MLPVQQLRLTELRTKCLEGQELTLDECREIISIMRDGRTNAAKVSKSAKVKAPTAEATANFDPLAFLAEHFGSKKD